MNGGGSKVNGKLKEKVRAWVNNAESLSEEQSKLDEDPGAVSVPEWQAHVAREDQLFIEGYELLLWHYRHHEATALARQIEDESALKEVYDDNPGFFSLADYHGLLVRNDVLFGGVREFLKPFASHT